jgi:hypothetical protein
LYINETHEKIDVVPRRQGRFHLNALKFLESYCTNCLKITGLKNNGDGTVDLTVQLTHPFPGMAQYTGFDVKGIIMFNGSYLINIGEYWPVYPWIPPVRLSWKEAGDPEVLNADGYTPRWSPSFDSGSDLPIFNYWEGKYSTGVPNAHLNAYLDYYSLENRHVFLCNDHLSRTYRIWLPPGQPVVAGYAVEACWEPPTKMPVTDPVNDFPTSANQPEAYHFKYIVNNGEVITDPENCCGKNFECSDLRIECKWWNPIPLCDVDEYVYTGTGQCFYLEYNCPPDYESDFIPMPLCKTSLEDGEYLNLAIVRLPFHPFESNCSAYDLVKFTIDKPG